MSKQFAIRALGATALACVLAAPAYADDAAAAAPAKVKPAQQTGIETVFVTAQRRSEDLEKTPVAITVMSGAMLREQEIKTAIDLQNFAPSLTVTGNLGSRDTDVFTIRGQSQPFGGADPGVQTYFAEVPFDPSGHGSYYDMANVQVLNGPQGTLFGRNTTGGAVLFEPQRPTDQFGGYAEAQFGNYADREFDGAVNVPIVGDKLMVRGAFDIENRDGFTTDTVITGLGLPYTEKLDNVDTEAFRVGVTVRPFSHFENYVVFDYLRDRNNGTGAELTGIASQAQLTNIAINDFGLPPLVAAGLVASFYPQFEFALANQQALGPRATTSSIPLLYRRDSWGVTDIATYDITDHFRIKNIFGYRSDKEEPAFDYDGSFLPILDLPNSRTWISNSLQVTEEFQLAGESEDNAVKWVAGFYHELDHPGGYSEVERDVFGGGSGPFPFSSTEIESLTNGGVSNAIYGQASWNVSNWVKGLTLTAGGRYTWDHKVATALICAEPPFPSCPFPIPNTFPYAQPTQSANFHAPSWTLEADDQVTDDTMVYATFRRGYKSGGFNSGAPDANAFKPEFLTDVELGTKNNWTILDVPGRTNFDVYYGWYQDVQKNDLIVDEGIPSAFTFNAAKATIKGLEFSSTFIPDENFQVNVFYSYTDATYSSFVLPQTIILGVPGNFVDLSGSPFAYTPKNKFGMTPRFHIPIDPALGMPYISGTVYWQSAESFTDLGAVEVAGLGQSPVQKAYALFNFRLDWDNVLGQPFDASVFVNNAFNKTYAVGANALLNLTGTSATIYAPPRMWGIQLRYRFGADGDKPE